MRSALVVAALVFTACEAKPQTEVATTTAALDNVEDTFTDVESGISFPLMPGVTSKVQHFNPTLPAYKFRHLIELSIEGGTAVVIEIWDNPTQQSSREWFDENMKFLIDAETRVSAREATTDKLETVLLEQPQSPQSPSLTTALFGTSRRIFGITCVDGDSIASAYPRAIFEKVLENAQIVGER